MEKRIIKPKSLNTIAFYMVTMVTTIQVSTELLEKLKNRKIYDKESYEDIIWDLLEDTMELSEETKKRIKQAEKDIKEGRIYTHEQVKKELGLQMYSLKYTDSALKQLKKFDKKINNRIISTLERCRIRPYAHVKKLVGNPYYRLRAGDYRIIVDIKNNELIILVIDVGHRKNIYKRFFK